MRHGAQVCFVVALAVLFQVVFGCAPEIHDNGSIREGGALCVRELAPFALAEPVVILAGPLQIAETAKDSNEFLSTRVELVLGWRFRIRDRCEAMRLCEHDNVLKGAVHLEAAIRELHVLLVTILRGSFVRYGVVKLLVVHRLTLRWIADGHAGDATEGFSAQVLVALCLLHA